jgi:tripeptide aminopeptidase
LGADDKAGIAVLVTAAAYLLGHAELRHGPIRLIFTPDEETGRGLAALPFEKIGSINGDKGRLAACYTVDGGAEGEIESECFNAYKADILFSGHVVHLGDARGRLANAALMAADFAALLPRSESPEATDGRFGYYCVTDIQGSLESASCEVFLRDFSIEGMRRRLDTLDTLARAVETRFPGGKVTVKKEKQYLNMRAGIEKDPRCMALLEKAARLAGVEPRNMPIRGGTDGSRLTELGLPTPNIWTGGYNFHSKEEWLLVDGALSACRTVCELARLWAE